MPGCAVIMLLAVVLTHWSFSCQADVGYYEMECHVVLYGSVGNYLSCRLSVLSTRPASERERHKLEIIAPRAGFPSMFN